MERVLWEKERTLKCAPLPTKLAIYFLCCCHSFTHHNLIAWNRIQWHPSLRTPASYGHPDIKDSFVCPTHIFSLKFTFLIRIPVNTDTSVSILSDQLSYIVDPTLWTLFSAHCLFSTFQFEGFTSPQRMTLMLWRVSLA